MWAEYEQCCTYVPVTEVPGAHSLFLDHAPLPTIGSTQRHLFNAAPPPETSESRLVSGAPGGERCMTGVSSTAATTATRETSPDTVSPRPTLRIVDALELAALLELGRPWPVGPGAVRP